MPIYRYQFVTVLLVDRRSTAIIIDTDKHLSDMCLRSTAWYDCMERCQRAVNTLCVSLHCWFTFRNFSLNMKSIKTKI